MNRMIFISGGARSGKSALAQALAKNSGKKVVFIATCRPLDIEMKKRIALHKKSRPAAWKTVEAPESVLSALADISAGTNAVIIDCLGMYVSNLLCVGISADMIINEVTAIARTLTRSKFHSIVVSNEVGSGIVPANRLARDFRDILGTANQIMAARAADVYIMNCGIPLRAKCRGKIYGGYR